MVNTPKSLRESQAGQTTILFVLILGIVLMGFIAVAVEYSNLWFKRQTQQGIADAVCQAAAVNLLIKASSGTATAGQGFTPGTDFDCSAHPTWAACQYATINGSSLSGLTANTESSEVHVSWPTTVDGISTPPSRLAGSFPFIQADATDRSRVFFTSLFTGNPTQDVMASAQCGLALSTAPIPLIVLHPTCAHSFEVSGSGTLKIVGGPAKSVQVNSNNQTCAAATAPSQCTGNGHIDLSEGGPNFTGSNFGVYGLPSATNAPSNYDPGSTGAWRQPSLPIPDPYALTPNPAVPAAAPAPTQVAYGVWGCPDHDAKCTLYQPGLYTDPIVVKGETAIFAPGIYYIRPTSYSSGATGGGLCGSPSSCATKPTGQCRGELVVDAGGVVRPAIDPSTLDAKAGAMFFFSGTSGVGYGNAVFVSSAGKSSRNIDIFDTARMTCTGGTPPDPKMNIAGAVNGNVLLAQCTTSGTYIDATANPTETAGKARGLLFFQDHANGDPKGQANMQGTGALIIAGTIYSHATDSQAFVQLQGNPGSNTEVFGEIITDQFVLSGNGSVAMQLSADRTIDVLKVQLLR